MQMKAKSYLDKALSGLLVVTISLFIAVPSPLYAQDQARAETAGGLQDAPPDIPPDAITEGYGLYPDSGPLAEDPSLSLPQGSALLEEDLAPSPIRSSKGPKGELVIEEGASDTGEDTISLDLRGIDITEILKVLSKKMGLNIIPSKKVTGRINLFLNNISYKDALDVVMLSQDLAYEKRSDDIVIVMTASEYESLYGKKFNDKKKMKTVKVRHAQPKMVFTALGSIKSSIGNVIVDEATGTILLIDTPEKLEEMTNLVEEMDQPVKTEAFELQYAKAIDIKDNIGSVLTEGSGKLATDERTNTIIVTDLPGNMTKVRQAIDILDQETKQVFIEAEILEINIRDRLRSGVDWTHIMTNNFYDFALAGAFSSTLVSSLIGTFSAGKAGLDLEFLSTIGDTRVLSRPRLAVTNNEEAVLLVGTREAYVTGTTSQSGESTITSDTVEFVDVGVKLTVVPTINRDGFITMKIKPEVSTVTETLTTGSDEEPRSQIPIVSTSEAETTVKIKDGMTIMIAGLRQNDDQRDVNGMPYVSRIPIVNLFFSQRDYDKQDTEIIVFITPHIIEGDQMESWDLRQMKKYPEYTRPDNREYIEKKLKRSDLKE